MQNVPQNGNWKTITSSMCENTGVQSKWRKLANECQALGFKEEKDTSFKEAEGS